MSLKHISIVLTIAAALALAGCASAESLIPDEAAPSATVNQAAVPDVTGATGDKAKKQLTEAGFTVNFDSGDDIMLMASNWVVKKQDPAAGSKADKGSEVTLQVTKVKAVVEKTTKGLTATNALSACWQAGDAKFPYGFRGHMFDHQEKLVKDKWVVSGVATVKNEYNAKRDAAFMCRVAGTNDSPDVEYFTAGD